MIIFHGPFSSFRDYLQFMPFGTIAWLAKHADLSKATINIAAAGLTIQQNTLDKLMKFTGLPRHCFGPVNDKRTGPTGKRVPVSK